MKISLLDSAQTGRKLSTLMRAHEEFHWAVAWATSGPLADLLHKYRRKINRISVGTHFAQTDPKFLEQYLESKTLKVQRGDGGTFHPKIPAVAKGRRRFSSACHP